MIKPANKQERNKNANYKKDKKKARKKLIKQLINIAKEKNLKIEDIVNIADYSEEYKKNENVIDELLTGNLIKEPLDGRCYFFPDNKAYITQVEETEHYLYCSENKKGETFYLNIWDIFNILCPGKYGEVMTNVVRAFGFNTTEEEHKETYRQQYINNIEIIEKQALQSWWLDYPNIYKLIKPALITLLKLNTLGLANVVSYKETINGKPIFFSSNEYLAEFMSIKKGTVINHISMLALLGFIEKVKESKVPKHLSQRAKKEKRNSKKPAMINFYSINIMTPELLKEIEKTATIIVKNGISIKNITLEKLGEVFEKDVADKVYGNNRNLIVVSTIIRQQKIKEKEEDKKIAKEEGEPKIPF